MSVKSIVTHKNKSKSQNDGRHGITLLTSTECHECSQFEPEWTAFLKEFNEEYQKDLPSNFIQHTVHDPKSKFAQEERKRFIKFVDEGKDGYPLLLFYINGRRWKPYWFGSRAFRTCRAIMFAFIIVYRICPSIWLVPPSIREEILSTSSSSRIRKKSATTSTSTTTNTAVKSSMNDVGGVGGGSNRLVKIEDIICDERTLDRLSEQAKDGIHYLANWRSIKNDMQEQFDEIESEKNLSERDYRNYPSFDRIIHLDQN